MTDLLAAAVLTPVLAKPQDDAEQVTQLLPGETVRVRETVADGVGEWSRIVAPAQPSSQDPEGYPGWVRSSALTRPRPVDAGVLLAEARRHLGTSYVWGGMTVEGIDCSGLTYMAARAAGVTIPRDARDQVTALLSVDLDEVRAGDLYFFAEPDGRVTHVALATGPVEADGSRPMIHADGDKMLVVEEPMPETRRARLVAAARITA